MEELLSGISGRYPSKQRDQRKHRNKRPREEPLKVVHPARDPHFLAYGAQDVIRAEKREEIDESQDDRYDFGWLNADPPLQKSIEARRFGARHRGRGRVKGHFDGSPGSCILARFVRKSSIRIKWFVYNLVPKARKTIL